MASANQMFTNSESVDRLGSDGFQSSESNSGHNVFFFCCQLGSVDF